MSVSALQTELAEIEARHKADAARLEKLKAELEGRDESGRPVVSLDGVFHEKIDLSKPIRSLREAAELSTTELGERLGSSQSNVSHLERNGRGVQLGTLVKVAKACGYEIIILAVPSEGGE